MTSNLPSVNTMSSSDSTTTTSTTNGTCDEIEELTQCWCCKRSFEEGGREPKLLACRHSFCLACAAGVLARPPDVACPLCWQRTAAPQGRADRLPTHAALLALTSRLKAERRAADARAALAAEQRRLRGELARRAARARHTRLQALDALLALRLRLESELCAPSAPADAPPDLLRVRLADAAAQARLDDLVRAATTALDSESVRRALAGLSSTHTQLQSSSPDPLLFLANYCLAQVYARRALAPSPLAIDDSGEDVSSTTDTLSPNPQLSAAVGSPIVRNLTLYPLFYFNLEVNGTPFGRIVIEVRSDVAPRMARNFTVLATGELGVGYRGCTVFQCWENESVITGDFELNNGRGGRSAFEESYFMPDDTKMVAVRGAVGMRRSQKRHDNLGLVGSQFRIMLREMRGFTAIFAYVVEGLELVDRLARTGDSAGKPHSTILISSCGKLN